MSDKVWDYRLVRSNKEDGTPTDWYSIQEVYYDDETGEPTAQTIDLQVEGEDKTELRKQLVDMVLALDKDVIGEIKSNVTDTPDGDIDINQKISNLEIENTDLKNMLRDKGVAIV